MERNEKADWIRVASKTYPGWFYLFNKTNGEQKWLPCSESEVLKNKKPEFFPKISANKVIKTPAQDRLKRLQNTIRNHQTKTPTLMHSSCVKPEVYKELENELKGEPTTSSDIKSSSIVSKKNMKRSAILSSGEDIPIKRVKASDIDTQNNLETQCSLVGNALTASLNTSSGSPEKINTPDSASVSNEDLIKLCAEISQRPKKFKNTIKKGFSQSLPASEKQSNKITKNNVKKKISNCNIKDFSVIPEENVALGNKIISSTHTQDKIPSYPKGSANSRLNRLKESLILQQQFCKSTNSSDLCTIPPKVSETNNRENLLLPKELFQNTVVSNCEVKPMDWEPAFANESPVVNSNCEPTSVVEKSKKFVLSKSDKNGNQTIGNIIDTVNENLMRLASENQKDSASNNKKWRKNFYYFVVDTNVLLSDLTFLEDLTKMKLCDTDGSMLYIPYSVLQELDKLKMRSSQRESVKTLAIRAIKYLNSKFENNSPYVQAQSALDERKHLINISSADDNIMNCCLQAKQHVPNLLLLTDDVNLRNKAICNNIFVSTKSDLLA